LLDVTVKSLSKDVMVAGAQKVGVLAQTAELRKVKEVNDRYVVAPEQQNMLVPFAVEVTGALGNRAREFLRQTKRGPRGKPEEAEPVLDADAPVARRRRVVVDLRDPKVRLLWRTKSLIAAAVHRQNAWDVEAYVGMLKARRAASA
jgi:hypothetical protein